ncbi:hypothetical protein XELAEV_18006294mg [Xenopus laevis]|uniref:E3 ubiquitin-protein ligase MARCHF2 n=1 Tax=Xenopus laevis TaxID=8355 RepID=A0A974DZL1_XENLA|nr:hypothetical protein XELAEV_18006294mg [Xenopus laevis]
MWNSLSESVVLADTLDSFKKGMYYFLAIRCFGTATLHSYASSAADRRWWTWRPRCEADGPEYSLAAESQTHHGCYIQSLRRKALWVAMTTGDCCHLPGSLCDCTGSATFLKSLEESDLGRPQYVTQVTAKDGQLLSTVIKALGTQSDGPICRICHEGGNGERLLSPCDCTGTLGTVHKTCLEKWLSSSNTSYCELCHTEFAVERRPRPVTEWLKDPGPRNEKRTLFCDMVSFRYHCQLYSEWRRTNQKVLLLIPDSKTAPTIHHSLLSSKLLKSASDETTV